MEFLIRMELRLPPDMDPAVKGELLENEAERARQLIEAGTIVRIWRIPGRYANAGLWEAADATALHDDIASLPLFPYADVEVTPLATHYLER